MTNKTVLLTGATGFVGRKILKYLQKNKYKIKIVARDRDIARKLESEDIQVIVTKDLFNEDISWMKNILTGIDTIIHSAWYAEPGKYLDSIKNIQCLNGTLNLGQAAKESNVSKFIGIGTCFEYDFKQKMPLTENSKLNPLSIYAATKVSTFYCLKELFEQTSISFSWCRLFYMFGEGEDERKLYSYLKKRLDQNLEVDLTSGQQVRDFMDVDEVGDKIVKLLKVEHTGPINICSGNPVSVKEFCQKIAIQENKQHLLKFGARKDNAFDPDEVYGIQNPSLQ